MTASLVRTAPPAAPGRVEVRLAATDAEREAALRLRYEGFNLHAGLGYAEAHATGLDRDRFDDVCDHLLAVTGEGRVVGTYRLLPEERAEGGFYNETEFDLAGLRGRGLRLLELGRSCVHPHYRDGGAIRALLRGILGYQRRARADLLFGAVSVPGFDPAEVQRIHRYLQAHRVEGYPWVRPYHPAPVEEGGAADPDVFWQLPPLFKGYLRLGAQLAGPPSEDRAFGTTDFFLVLRVSPGAACAEAA